MPDSRQKRAAQGYPVWICKACGDKAEMPREIGRGIWLKARCDICGFNSEVRTAEEFSKMEKPWGFVTRYEKDN